MNLDFEDLPLVPNDEDLGFLVVMALAEKSRQWLFSDDVFQCIEASFVRLRLSDPQSYAERGLDFACKKKWIITKPSVPNNLCGLSYEVSKYGFTILEADPPWRMRAKPELDVLECDWQPPVITTEKAGASELRVPHRKFGAESDHNHYWAVAVSLSKKGAWWQNKAFRQAVLENIGRHIDAKKASRWLNSVSSGWDDGRAPLEKRSPDNKARLTEYRVNPSWQ